MSPGDTEIHRVEPEDVANHLTAFHWELFRCVHEVGTVAGAGLGGLGGEMCQRGGPGDGQRVQLNLGLEGWLAGGPWAIHPNSPHTL